MVQYKNLPCEDCGTLVCTRQVGRNAVLCPGCARDRRNARNREYWARNKDFNKLEQFEIRIVYDPLPVEEGGFGKGKRFDQLHHHYNLTNRVYMPGTRIEKRNGKIYEIIKVKQHFEEKLLELGG